MLSRWTLSAALLVLAAVPVTAQKIEITPFFGFQFGGDFDDRFDQDDFDGVDVDEGETYGIFVSFALADFSVGSGSQIELMYHRQDTKLQADRLFGPQLLDLELEYWHLGFLYQWAQGQLRPFVVASLGATSLDPGGAPSETRFSWSIGGGVKLMFGENFGLRFDGRFNSTLIDENDIVFCDPIGCFAYDNSTFLNQFDVKAGIVLAF